MHGGDLNDGWKLRNFLVLRWVKKKRKRKKRESKFSRKNFKFNKRDHSWTVVGDYSPPEDKISIVARDKKKNSSTCANAFANNAVCDRVSLLHSP
jgi:hypothetical protein